MDEFFQLLFDFCKFVLTGLVWYLVIDFIIFVFRVRKAKNILEALEKQSTARVIYVEKIADGLYHARDEETDEFICNFKTEDELKTFLSKKDPYIDWLMDRDQYEKLKDKT